MSALRKVAKQIGIGTLLAAAAGLIAAFFRPARAAEHGPEEPAGGSDQPEHFAGETPAHRVRKRIPGRPTMILLATAAVALASVLFTLRVLAPGPEQPVPFSHRLHVSTKDLSCFFCHTGALDSAQAGIPSVDKCLLCHKVIVPNWEPVARIARYAERGEGVPWRRVNEIADFVRFSHEPHIARGFDCAICHGNVRAMDRVKPAHRFTMGFCVDCHKENNASVDCSRCHY